MAEQDPEPGARIWRVLPEFPKYEIDSDGQVRNRRTKRPLVETQDPRGGTWYYSLNTGSSNQHKAKRVYEKLLYSAFPELDPGWWDLPNFPGYEINQQGEVRSKLRMKPIGRTPSGHYRLYKRIDGVRTRHYWKEVA